MASWQFQGSCYPSPEAANQALAATVTGSVDAGMLVSVGSVSATELVYTFTPVAGGSPVVLTLPHVPPDCQLVQLEDGLALSWMVAGCWIAAYAIKFITEHVMRTSSVEASL